MLSSLCHTVQHLPKTARAAQISCRALFSAQLPQDVMLYEVGPRDGLQNEKQNISTDIKVEFINKLSASGLKAIEATSFVSPKWVPQLADGADVMAKINKQTGVRYPVLTPNIRGLENAVKAGVKEVAIFGAASEAFSKKNINCSIDESLKRFEEVVSAAKKEGVDVRGYVSCAVDCPYSGKVDPKAAAAVAGALDGMGCYEVHVANMFSATLRVVPASRLAAHCHDTYGQAIANIYQSLLMGIRTLDTSIAGLGGCPYAKGAAGNVATEDVLFLLDGLGIKHGVDLERILDASKFISTYLGRPSASKAAQAFLAKRTA
ncbi:hydroxymethylglutaryl-CoA lyase-like protein [Dunaliella salina]|uniref:hydroxymethylglutaryl-CoA lyase n=1 Tax=Dunaliella salina TaxID=3046 RepID=A0ABQ7GY39_DUNSA|nr:hydroxymethylglutaryl-CoA lyase-like protein [Dunaliella salina]|eukprot:KAF5839518.1 hydroxymethylglutaryl-CoA lyase-like protein [Dunaliella salina]